MAVRLARGETHMIAQAKDWLSSHGVSLEALQRAVEKRAGAERSKTLILVKNLDAQASEDELTGLFGKHGQLGSTLLAPGNALALVEFLEARRALPHPAASPRTSCPSLSRLRHSRRRPHAPGRRGRSARRSAP